MEGMIGIVALMAPAACIGMGLAALAVRRLRKEADIHIERGAARELPGDAHLSW